MKDKRWPPTLQHSHIMMAHGGGGRFTEELIEKIFLPSFSNKALNARHDGALVQLSGEQMAFTTDSYVIHPLFFPGGDIGKLAVWGTANDLAMCGAQPLYLSAGFILEEGLPMETLWRVARSMKESADRVGVQVVTGDTKVVERGKGDGIFINTAGIGVVAQGLSIGPHSVQVGDAILLSGDIGRHGIAIMSAREGLDFETTIQSDCAPLWSMVQNLMEEKIPLHCLRDLTRGGLATALLEVAQSRGVAIDLQEKNIPIEREVKGASELLGLDPLYIANEGRFIAFVPMDKSETALGILRKHPQGAGAQMIGIVNERANSQGGRVTLENSLGTHRILTMFSGEQLPRIC